MIVSGASAKRWDHLKDKLLDSVEKLLDSVLDHQRQTTVRDEAKSLTSAGLGLIRAKLAMAGLEAEKIEAEVAGIYGKLELDKASARKTDAEARKLNAEAEAKEIENSIKKLRLFLALNRAILKREDGEAAILFGRQIEDTLIALNELGEEFAATSGQLPKPPTFPEPNG